MQTQENTIPGTNRGIVNLSPVNMAEQALLNRTGTPQMLHFQGNNETVSRIMDALWERKIYTLKGTDGEFYAILINKVQWNPQHRVFYVNGLRFIKNGDNTKKVQIVFTMSKKAGYYQYYQKNRRGRKNRKNYETSGQPTN